MSLDGSCRRRRERSATSRLATRSSAGWVLTAPNREVLDAEVVIVAADADGDLLPDAEGDRLVRDRLCQAVVRAAVRRPARTLLLDHDGAVTAVDRDGV